MVKNNLEQESVGGGSQKNKFFKKKLKDAE